jgi:hypothetical protein
MADGRFMATRPTARSEAETLCKPMLATDEDTLPSVSVVVDATPIVARSRDGRAAATVPCARRRPQNPPEMPTWFSRVALRVAMLTIGIVLGEVLGSMVVPSPARAEKRSVVSVTRSVTASVRAVRGKAVTVIPVRSTSARNLRRPLH